MAAGWKMWAIFHLKITLLLPLLSAAPLDIVGGSTKADAKADNDGMHNHDGNVTEHNQRGGKMFSLNQFDIGNINVSGSVVGNGISIGNKIKIDVHESTNDHHHHKADSDHHHDAHSVSGPLLSEDQPLGWTNSLPSSRLLGSASTNNKECYSDSTTSRYTLGCADGSEAPRWDGCYDKGSYRVRCPKYYFPCNDLRLNAEFQCGSDCSSLGGKRSDCIKEIKCYSEPTTSEETLGCASGYEAPLWDGCIDDGSYRVRCPKGYFPCNDLRNNGKEFKCGIDCSNKGGKRSDCIEENLPLCYSEPTTYEDKLECANGELAYLWDGCIDQDSYRIRCPKGYVPCVDIRKNGKEFMCGTDCSTKGGKRSDCIEDYLPKSGNWILLFRQTINGKDRFYKKNEWIRNKETVDAPNYSILGDFDKFRKPDGSFHLVLGYPELGTFNEWTQTSNPVTKTTRGVDNYKAIRTPYTGFYWGGLEHNNGEALLDGSVDNAYWWYAIGSFTDFRGGIPGPGIPGPGGIPNPKDAKGSHVVKKVELYIDPGCVEKFDYDTDYKGGDVSDGANVKSNNKEDCRNICRVKTGCNFWTFVKSWSNNCLLKYSSEGKERHSGYVSGNICKGVDVLRLYEHVEEAGRSLTLYGPTNLQLRNFNNLASSVHAVKGDWELYVHPDYSGNRMFVKQGQKINTDRNDKYSSARPICQYYDDQSTAKLKVYERVSSQGEEKEFLNEERDLGNDWSNKISSVHVVKGDWELYEHKNYHGVREVVKEGDQIDVQHKDFHSSLRPICETYTYTYTPKCTPVHIEILGDPNSLLKFKGSKIIGAASDFSCSDPSTKTLTLNSGNSVTKSISLGTSKSEGIDWSVGASATITGKVGFLGSGTEVSGTISGSTGGSTSVTYTETESFAQTFQTSVGSSITYTTPGAAIVFGFVDIYETDNSDVQVKIHLDCDGKKKEELSTMKLTSHTFQSADFFSFFREIDNAEDCNKDGFITKIDECIRNVRARYINGFGEQEEMKKDFDDCFA